MLDYNSIVTVFHFNVSNSGFKDKGTTSGILAVVDPDSSTTRLDEIQQN